MPLVGRQRQHGTSTLCSCVRIVCGSAFACEWHSTRADAVLQHNSANATSTPSTRACGPRKGGLKLNWCRWRVRCTGGAPVPTSGCSKAACPCPQRTPFGPAAARCAPVWRASCERRCDGRCPRCSVWNARSAPRARRRVMRLLRAALPQLGRVTSRMLRMRRARVLTHARARFWASALATRSQHVVQAGSGARSLWELRRAPRWFPSLRRAK